MKDCRLTITTTVDGQETNVTRLGKMDLQPLGVTLYYREENAEVTIHARTNRVEIERKGDYSMRLTFVENELLSGTLGIGGNEGSLQTQTHRLAFSVTEHSFLLLLQYALIFSKEKQEMKIRISARENG